MQTFSQKTIIEKQYCKFKQCYINVTEVNKRDDSHDKIVQVCYLKTVPEKENSDEKLKIFNNRKGGKRLKLMELKAQVRL